MANISVSRSSTIATFAKRFSRNSRVRIESDVGNGNDASPSPQIGGSGGNSRRRSTRRILTGKSLVPTSNGTRRATELIEPEIVNLLRQETESTMPDGTSILTISLSRDIFMTIAVLKAYHIWEEILPRHRHQLLILSLICIVLQLGLLVSLSVEIAFIRNWEVDEGGVTSQIATGGRIDWLSLMTNLSIKFFCVFAVVLYIFKEFYELKAYRRVRREIADFRDTLSHSLSFIYNVYSTLLYVLAMGLSVVLISTADSGADAVLNAVAILFVLDVDNWIYHMIKSHKYIRDELFDIKYEKNEEVSLYVIAKFRYLSSMCFRSYKGKAEGDESFVQLFQLFQWLMMILALTVISFGVLHEVDLFVWSGVGLMGLVVMYLVCKKIAKVIVLCMFNAQNKRKLEEFVGGKLQKLCHVHVKEMVLKGASRELAHDSFVWDCFTYFEDNCCGCRESTLNARAKLCAAFDEYYNKCDKSKVDTTDLDIGALALSIQFKL